MEDEKQNTKLRILCLHGFRTSGLILKKLVERWPQPLLQKLDLVYMDGPYPAQGKSDVDGIFEPPFYEWFQSDQEFKEFYNFEECFAKIEEFMVTHGPFDGVLGFSQGALLTAAIPGMQRKMAALTKVKKVKFVIIISGAKFGGSKFGLPKLASDSFSTPITTPSLHLIGDTDFMKEESIALQEAFVDPVVIRHPKGHTIPRLDSMVNIKDTFGRWRKKVGEATKKAEDFAGNTWQHLKTAPSLTDGALGRIAQGTKVLAEGGYEKIFRQTFETVPEELLVNSYACYLSTSAGPVLGVIYVSTAKIAFCSDNPLSYKTNDKTEWSYYKVIIPLQQMKAVNPSSSKAKSAEKYIQVISVDGHEFWYMGFLNYDGAVKCLQDALQTHTAPSIV
ncbi:hypothetical protein R6Q57_026211 [Mikania cordata]